MGSIRMNLSESGLLLSINSEEKYTEISKSPEMNEKVEESYPDIFKYYADNNLFEQVDTIIETINGDSGKVEKQVLKKTIVEKSVEQRAQEAADFILNLKQKKFNLISAYQEIAYSEGTVEYMYEQMENLEKEYLKLFTGLTFKKTLHYSFSYLPEKNGDVKSDVIFRFSDRYGVEDTDGKMGENVLLTIKRSNYTKELSQYVRKRMYNNRQDGGIAYRIPEEAMVSVNYGGEVLKNKKLLIDQFGVITRLPKSNIKVVFYPESGALKSVNIGK